MEVAVARSCDGSDCKICSNLILSSEDATGITVPSKRIVRFSKKTIGGFQIKWDVSQKVNYFHSLCLSNEMERMGKIELNLIHYIKETEERYDSIDKVEAAAEKLAELLKASFRTVCFTGAGISKSAGIPTYRGADGIDTASTFAKTGISNNKSASVSQQLDEDDDVDYTKLIPTSSHFFLSKLFKQGLLQYCITQNCDDLHSKGGFPPERLSELHGNVFFEFCEVCQKEFKRDFCVDLFSTDCYKEPWYEKCPSCQFNHYTGRKCDNIIEGKQCKGSLRDTIVNFGDDLHEKVLGGLPRAEQECQEANLCLVLGSSLTVTPAASLCAMASQLVICNLQETDYDNAATLRIWASCENLVHFLAEKLGFVKSISKNQKCRKRKKNG